ncbi:hypothetical protein R0Q57_00150 [Lactobacillus acidophilus]
MNFNVNDRYKLNAATLVIGVIMGLIFGFATGSTIPLVLLPLLSQFSWISDCVKRVLFKDDVQALIKLTDSATLYNSADRFSRGRYGRAVNYHLERHEQEGYYLLKIEANGIKGSTKLDSLAGDVTSAFGHPAFIVEQGPGYATYRIDIERKVPRVNENDF